MVRELAGRIITKELLLCLMAMLVASCSSAPPPATSTPTPVVPAVLTAAVTVEARPATPPQITAVAEATSAPAPPPRPTPQVAPVIPATPAPQSLVAGRRHACALAWDLTAYCWGDDTSGGASPPENVRFISLAAGDAATCGLREDGSVRCWGIDRHGMTSPPEQERFVQISAAASHACGLRADGQAVCWGGGDEGPVAPPPHERFASLTVAGTYACGLRWNGSALCWGTDADESLPASGRFFALAVSDHGCGLLSDESAVCWGNDDAGQASPPSGERFVVLTLGSSHTCGLHPYGKPRCWGSDEHGEVSPPTTVIATPLGRNRPDRVREGYSPERLAFASIAAGNGYTCGQRSDLAVACWGRDDFGQASPPLAAFTDLRLAEPRHQPAGYALFSRLRGCFWHCDSGPAGVMRTIFDESTGALLAEDPLALLGEIGYFQGFWMSDDRSLMVVTRCAVGDCGGLSDASDDAVQELSASRDGGATWESWATVDPAAWVRRITNDDIAVREPVDPTSPESGRQIRWVRAGTVFPVPSADLVLRDWDGDRPIWGEPTAPFAPAALSVLGDWRWLPAQTYPDGRSVWHGLQLGQGTLLVAILDRWGAAAEVYGWRNADYVPYITEIGPGMFVGFSIRNAHWGLADGHMPFLIDLAAGSVHPLLGLTTDRGWSDPWRSVPLPAARRPG